MAEQRCIYGPKHGRKFKEELALLRQSKLDAETKHLVEMWLDHLFAKGSGELRVVKLAYQIRRIALDLKRPLAHITRDDLESLIARYNRASEWSECTKSDYRRALKQFFNWFEERDERLRFGEEEARKLYAYLRKHVTMAYREKALDYSMIIAQEDLELLIEKGAASVKERAFLAMLHEGGFRAAEILNVQLRDLDLRTDRYFVKVDGKTGQRVVPLCWSMGHVAAWLGLHPERDNPAAYLWVTENQNPALRGLPLKHGGAQKILNRSFAASKLKKKKNLHWFRHSRATINARFMTESVLCRFFGWGPGSRVVRKYVHMNVDQIEAAVMNMNGVSQPQEEAQKPTRCGCGLMNQPVARYCLRCGKPLSVSVMLKDDEQKMLSVDEAFSELARILGDPARRAAFEEFQKARTK